MGETFKKLKANPAGLGSIILVILLLGLYLANNLVADFFVDINPILFIILIGAGVFALMKAFGELKAGSVFELKEVLIIFGTIGGIVFVLIQYPQIAPTFSVLASEAVEQVASVFGGGL